MAEHRNEQARRMGRPPKAADERKSATMRFRTREGLREKLEEAAERSGRSASEEAEIRLINSFTLEPLHQLVFGGGPDARRFLNDVITTIRTIEDYHERTGRSPAPWKSNALVCSALRAAFPTLIDASIPQPPPPSEVPWSEEDRQRYANALLEMEEFGREFAELITGQRPRLATDLDRDGAAEH